MQKAYCSILKDLMVAHGSHLESLVYYEHGNGQTSIIYNLLELSSQVQNGPKIAELMGLTAAILVTEAPSDKALKIVLEHANHPNPALAKRAKYAPRPQSPTCRPRSLA